MIIYYKLEEQERQKAPEIVQIGRLDQVLPAFGLRGRAEKPAVFHLAEDSCQLDSALFYRVQD